MHIGIAFDLKPTEPLPVGAPDDLHEEFDSPVTIRAIGDVFRSLGHTVTELGNGKPLLEALLRQPPDLVFNFAEGLGVGRNREARVPAVCEMLGVPYSGSDAFAMAAALDKEMARRLISDAGVTVPKGFVLRFDDQYDGDFREYPAILADLGMECPVIAKPVCEGSSKGIRSRCLIRTPDELGPTAFDLWKSYGQPVLVEEFISGTEVTVGIIGNDPPDVFGMMSIEPKAKNEQFVYSLEVKRDFRRQVDYFAPPPLPASVTTELSRAALTAFDALGCVDVARIDFRVRDGVPYFLEINPLPGLNPESSDLVIMANLLNVSHAELVERILNASLKRLSLD
ncbi:MAG: D-alanine--D-alanine ligase [Gemmataceae bacterium]